MLSTFLTSLAGGMLATLAIFRADQTAWKFMRLVTVIAFVLTSGVLAWRAFGPLGDAVDHLAATVMTALCAVGALGLMITAPIARKLESVFRWGSLAGGAFGMSAGCLWMFAGLDDAGGTWFTVAAVLAEVSGALVIGAVTVAWLLGHAYLTATRMTIAPLVRVSRLLMAVVLIRLAYSLACLILLWAVGTEWGIWGPNWVGGMMVVGLRVGVGLVVLSMFAYMVLDCVRLRSTQSATGILYFASVLAYIGELSGQYLLEQWGWPV